MSRHAARDWMAPLAIALVVGLGVAPAAAQGGRDEPAGVERANRLIVMINGLLGGAETLGAGIVVGAGEDRLYIATANHVVRRGEVVAERLRVRFRSLPGEAFEARILDDHDADLDLAVLVVGDLKRHNIPAEAIPFDLLGAPRALKRGDPVFHVGYAQGRSWYSPVRPDTISADAPTDWLTFESTTVRPGQSGGGLFTERWELVGLIKGDEQPDGRALSVDRVIETLKAWGYPVALTAALRPPPTVTGAKPGSAAPGATSKLCVSLSGGEGEEMLVVSGPGVRREVESDQCIEVLPGTYSVAVAEADVPWGQQCPPAEADLASGETRRVRLSCRADTSGAADLSGAWSLTVAGQVISRLVFTRIEASRYRFDEFAALGLVGQGTATLDRDLLTLEGTSSGVPISGDFHVSGQQMTGVLRSLAGALPAFLSRWTP